MNANELMLGNYFIGYSNYLQQWELASFALLIEGIEVDEIIRSFVPITKKWLIDFGFKKIYLDSNLFLNITNDIYFFWYDNKLKGCVKNHYMNYDNQLSELEFELNIQFVHQLQNLYFSFTGTHLKLVEPK